MVEITCEPKKVCDNNEEIFKGLLASNLAFVTRLAPYTASKILPQLQGSAVGAAKQCSGGNNGTLCGRCWYQSEWDGTADFEEQMSASNIFTSNLIAFKDTTLATNATSNQISTSTQTQGATTSSTDKPNEGSTILKSHFGVAFVVTILGQYLV